MRIKYNENINARREDRGVNAVVVITNTGKRIVRKFVEEGMGESFKIKAEKYFPNHKIFLVSITNHIPKPEEYSPQRSGTYYCPYCGEERRYYFPDNSDRETGICPICHISTRDFHVRQLNGIWPKAKGTNKKKGRR